MKHLIVILCESAPSFCHYSIDKEKTPNLISLEKLRQAVLFAMKENAIIQFIYPKYKLPQEYYELINTTRHINITPFISSDDDTIVNLDRNCYPPLESLADSNIIIRLGVRELTLDSDFIKKALSAASRINLALVFPEKIEDKEIECYSSVLSEFVKTLVDEYLKDHFVEMNIVTDRAFLPSMNNCNAGIDSLTVAPNGDIFICPGFFYDRMDSIGNISEGYKIRNKHLYEIAYAPICRICDAFQCKRCIWKNRNSTLEVNTPSHEQCVLAHIERNASAEFVKQLRKEGFDSSKINDIQISDVLDPFYNLPRITLK